MRRLLALGVGLVMIIAPNRIVDAAERIAFENPHAGRLRPQTRWVGRLKGVVFVYLFGRHPEQTSILKRPLTIIGLVMALVPRQSLGLGLELAYENPEELEVKPWVLPATRVLGACYLVIGIATVRATGLKDEDAAPANA